MEIFVVDDCDVVRETLSELLVTIGHTVTAFANPLQALDELEGRQIDLLVTDVRMPTMSGTQLAVAARKIPGFDDLPILFITGYSDDPNLSLVLTQSTRMGLLKKPLRFQNVLEKILDLTENYKR